MSKPKLLEPNPLGGGRSSKELENYMWDMEQYFNVTKIDVGEQVNITVMYLIIRWCKIMVED